MYHAVIRRFSSASKPRKVLKPRANREIIVKQRATNEAHEKKALELGLQWRVVAASVLHRYPVIMRDAPLWESKMWDLEELIESKKREHLMELVGGTDAQLIPDNEPTVEEIYETLPFKPASRISDADLKSDIKSTDRSLAKSLFLIVKRNRSANSWQFPQGKWNTGETMRQAAERVGDRAVGRVNRYYISNAPIGHYCYAYPPALQEQRKQYGAKVFFYRTQLITGNIKLETKLYKDFAWISRDEVGKYFDENTAEYMSHLLPF